MIYHKFSHNATLLESLIIVCHINSFYSQNLSHCNRMEAAFHDPMTPCFSARSCGAVGGESDSSQKSQFDSQSGQILSFLLPLIQEGSCQVLLKVCAVITGKKYVH